MTIPDLSLTEWLMIAAASWAVLAAVVAVPVGRAMRKADRQPEPEPEIVNWLPLLPLVPPSRREPDADWLDVWPVDGLSDDEVYVRFNRLMDAA